MPQTTAIVDLITGILQVDGPWGSPAKLDKRKIIYKGDPASCKIVLVLGEVNGKIVNWKLTRHETGGIQFWIQKGWKYVPYSVHPANQHIFA